jgi:hypothetical protein
MKKTEFLEQFSGTCLARDVRAGTWKFGGALPAVGGRVVTWSSPVDPPGQVPEYWTVEIYRPEGDRWAAPPGDLVGNWASEATAARAASTIVKGLSAFFA